MVSAVLTLSQCSYGRLSLPCAQGLDGMRSLTAQLTGARSPPEYVPLRTRASIQQHGKPLPDPCSPPAAPDVPEAEASSDAAACITPTPVPAAEQLPTAPAEAAQQRPSTPPQPAERHPSSTEDSPTSTEAPCDSKADTLEQQAQPAAEERRSPQRSPGRGPSPVRSRPAPTRPLLPSTSQCLSPTPQPSRWRVTSQTEIQPPKALPDVFLRTVEKAILRSAARGASVASHAGRRTTSPDLQYPATATDSGKSEHKEPWDPAASEAATPGSRYSRILEQTNRSSQTAAGAQQGTRSPSPDRLSNTYSTSIGQSDSKAWYVPHTTGPADTQSHRRFSYPVNRFGGRIDALTLISLDIQEMDGCTLYGHSVASTRPVSRARRRTSETPVLPAACVSRTGFRTDHQSADTPHRISQSDQRTSQPDQADISETQSTASSLVPLRASKRRVQTRVPAVVGQGLITCPLPTAAYPASTGYRPHQNRVVLQARVHNAIIGQNAVLGSNVD